MIETNPHEPSSLERDVFYDLDFNHRKFSATFISRAEYAQRIGLGAGKGLGPHSLIAIFDSTSLRELPPVSIERRGLLCLRFDDVQKEQFPAMLFPLYRLFGYRKWFAHVIDLLVRDGDFKFLPFDTHSARRLAAFVHDLPERERLYVCCTYGKSRSRAVVAALCKVSVDKSVGNKLVFDLCARALRT